MSDYFSRLIQRTTGQLETVQPLISPVYGSLSNKETNMNLQTEKPAVIEASENINSVEGSLRANKNTSIEKDKDPDRIINYEEPIKEKIKPPQKDIHEKYHFTEKDRVYEQDTEVLIKKENITLVDSKNKSMERSSEYLLPENRSSAPHFPEDVRGTDIKEKGTVDNNKRKNIKTSYHLLPLSFKDRPVLQRIDNIGHKKSNDKNNIYNDIKFSPEATSVKINIGRIEVKAIIQQKTKQPHTLKQEPNLSLDEYLKQRKTGER